MTLPNISDLLRSLLYSVQVALERHSAVLTVLHELPYRAFPYAEKKEFTYEVAVHLTNKARITRYKQHGVAICDILVGQVVIDWFAYSSNLEVMISLIFTFFDQ